MNTNFKVNLTKIKKVTPHLNAERLELAEVYGFNVVVQKGRYKEGDIILYVPIDSILSEKVENIVFPPDSKIKLHKHRVRQIKLRGIFSQGLIIDPENVSHLLKSPLHLENDYAKELGIFKYEPPAPSYQGVSQPRLRDKPLSNPYFREYSGITNIKWHPELFESEQVVIQEKLHGSHIRFGKAPFVANTLWKKIMKFFKLTPRFENVYGSNRVELTNRKGYTGFYGEDIYGQLLKKEDVFSKIEDGEFVHAEIIGPGIQKGYDYSLKEHQLVIFDVRNLQSDGTQKWMNPEEVEEYAKQRGFKFVPVLYKGPFSKEVVDHCTKGPSVFDANTKIREGCVVKSRYNYDNEQNKRCLKSINPDYLAGDQTDFH